MIYAESWEDALSVHKDWEGCSSRCKEEARGHEEAEEVMPLPLIAAGIMAARIAARSPVARAVAKRGLKKAVSGAKKVAPTAVKKAATAATTRAKEALAQPGQRGWYVKAFQPFRERQAALKATEKAARAKDKAAIKAHFAGTSSSSPKIRPRPPGLKPQKRWTVVDRARMVPRPPKIRQRRERSR